MTQTCFVFASKAEKSPESVIKKYIPELVDDYDIHFLCSDNKEKILKKDIDMDINILDDYKLVCPIGAESLKYTAGMTGITKYNGVHIEKKYLPIMHPNLIVFKPQYEDEIIKAKPTDGLWGDDRTDEDQLGATYDELEWAMNYSDDPKKLLGRHKEVYYIYNKFHKQNKHKMVAIPVFKK